MRRKVVIYLLLVVATLAVYSQVRHYEFVDYDDPEYVPENGHVRAGLTWEGTAWAFTTSSAANWFPLTWLSYMADSQLFGIESGASHLTNLLFHVLSTLLLFAMLERMTGARWRSAMVAFLFALHPLHVESVAWVAERKDVLSAFFFFLTVWCYLRYVERPSRGRYLLVVLAFCLGLMSKPMVVTLPFVLLLLDLWPLRRIKIPALAFGAAPAAGPADVTPSVSAGKLLLEKAPLLALSAASCVITYLVQRRGGAVIAIEGMSVGSRIANAIVSYIAYLAQMFWPTRLAAFYPRPVELPAWEVAGDAFLLAAITFAAWRLLPRHPYFTIGWLWYLGTLVPVIGLVQVGDQARADRYTYIPLVGIFIILAWGATEVVRSEHAVGVLAAAVCSACAALTWFQIQHWRNSETLFRHALDVTAGNYIAYNGVGLVLRNQGKVDEAVPYYLSALRSRPTFSDARVNLGDARIAQGRADEALTETLEALRLKPDSPIAHANLGAALNKLGRKDEALMHYREAIRLNPNSAVARCGFGMILYDQGQKDQALEELREAIRIKPDYADGHYDLGWLLAQLGRVDEAAIQFEEAVRLHPADAEAHFNLGNALGDQGKLADAMDQFSAAIRLKPNYANAHLNLGKAMAMSGQLDASIAQFQEALRLDPELAEARENLADALSLRREAAKH